MPQQQGLFGACGIACESPRKKTIKRRRFNDLSGKKFGRLLVESYAGADKWNKTLWLCKCKCGNQVVVQQSNLGRSAMSCGCLNQESRVARMKKHKIPDGGVFGFWVVIKESEQDRRGGRRYLCECVCGVKKIISGDNLTRGSSKSCGCKGKPKKEKPLKRKPIDREQMAKDLYCWYLDGWTIRKIAHDNGYARGGTITVLFNKYIPGHKDASENRRENSLYNESQVIRKLLSDKFNFEKEFQMHCSNILHEAGIGHEINNTTHTGFEVDLLTDRFCFECKVSIRKKDAFTAIGQLITNAQISKQTPILLIPSDIDVPEEMLFVFKKNNIKIANEKNLTLLWETTY